MNVIHPRQKFEKERKERKKFLQNTLWYLFLSGSVLVIYSSHLKLNHVFWYHELYRDNYVFSPNKRLRFTRNVPCIICARNKKCGWGEIMKRVKWCKPDCWRKDSSISGFLFSLFVVFKDMHCWEHNYNYCLTRSFGYWASRGIEDLIGRHVTNSLHNTTLVRKQHWSLFLETGSALDQDSKTQLIYRHFVSTHLPSSIFRWEWYWTSFLSKPSR
jgi:hypothetical protein